MAKTHSFDVSTGVDLQEVDNALNQARTEIAQRYDFKGVDVAVDFDRDEGIVRLEADDEYRLTAVFQVVREKLARRKVPLKNLEVGGVEKAGGGRARQVVTLKQGLDSETAKRISKDVRDAGLKKVQTQIQGEEVRVSAPSRDTLQEVIALLRAGDYGVELRFGNYR